ncbi:hypothetical protein EZS27_013720 [termite gut metagenome]|jgi:hypothetical protein|uniref:Uncharacterized protein n=1 Tax=termite gut metagenome TaxID=433724 RepID=A0A5J4RWT7_9ZZZZ
MEMDAIITEKTFDEMNLPNTVYKYRNWNDINHKKMELPLWGLLTNRIHYL